MSAECSLGNHRYLGPSRHTIKKEHEQYRVINFGLGSAVGSPSGVPLLILVLFESRRRCVETTIV